MRCVLQFPYWQAMARSHGAVFLHAVHTTSVFPSWQKIALNANKDSASDKRSKEFITKTLLLLSVSCLQGQSSDENSWL